MKNILVATILLLSLAKAAAADPRSLYDVRCTACLSMQTIAPTAILSTGGYSTNINGIAGTMSQCNGNFHCTECHTDFMVPIKPDRFVPTTVATPARPAAGPKLLAPRLSAPEATAGTNSPPAVEMEEVLVRTIALPDGTEMVVYHRRPKK